MKRIIEKLKRPSILFLVIFYICFIALIFMSIISILIDNKVLNILSYFIYTIAFVSLIYFIYTIIYIIPIIRTKIIKILISHSFTKELLENYNYRTIMFSFLTFLISIAFMIYEIILSVINHSFWFASLSIYYIVIAALLGFNSYYSYKHNLAHDNSNEAKLKKIKLYRLTGFFTLFVALIFNIELIQMVKENKAFSYIGIFIYVAALYTFIKVGFAIYHIVKSKKTQDFAIQSIRNIFMLDALVSLMSLQTALLATFDGGEKSRIFNASIGGLISISIITIATIMIIRSYKYNIKK